MYAGAGQLRYARIGILRHHPGPAVAKAPSIASVGGRLVQERICQRCPGAAQVAGHLNQSTERSALLLVRALADKHCGLAKRLAKLEDKTETLAMSHDTFSRNTRNHLKQLFDTS